jgi:hypothetical protein
LPFREELALAGLPLTQLNELLVELRARKTLDQPAYQEVVQLTELGDFVNNRIELVRKINPNVWAAARTVMRYAAFFRYCNENAPADWQAFARRVSSISAQPAVSTPTVLQLASVPKVNAGPANSRFQGF